MFGSSRIGFCAAVAMAAAAPGYCTGVQVSLASSFNADTVLRYSGGVFTGPTTSWDNSTAGGSVDNWMVTQSAANQLALLQGGTASGINDNGFYAAGGARLYDVQLGFTNATATGTSTTISSTTAGSFTFSVPGNNYSQFAIIGSSGSGNSTLTITMNYSTGSPVVLTGVTLPDWYSGSPSTTAAGAAGTYYALTPALSRQAAYRFPSAGFQSPTPSGGSYIYGVNLGPDSTRQLTSVTVAYNPSSPGYTVANFVAAAGALANPGGTSVPAVGTWGMLAAIALMAAMWLWSVRKVGVSGMGN